MCSLDAEHPERVWCATQHARSPLPVKEAGHGSASPPTDWGLFSGPSSLTADESWVIGEGGYETGALAWKDMEARESRRGWVVLLLLVSCSRAESAGPFEEGLRLYEAGRRAEAIPYFDRAIAADPKQKGAWLYRGRAYGETQNDGEAFHSYEQALRLDPCYAEAFFQRGRTYLWERSPERAIREFSSAIRCDPKVSKYYLHRASVHHQSFTPDMLTNPVHYQAALSDYAGPSVSIPRTRMPSPRVAPFTTTS